MGFPLKSEEDMHASGAQEILKYCLPIICCSDAYTEDTSRKKANTTAACCNYRASGQSPGGLHGIGL
jgi:hypothetical protein